MFENITASLAGRGWELLVIGSIVCLVLIGLYRAISGAKGTWTENLTVEKLRFKEKTRSRTSVPSNKGGSFDSKGELECRRVLQKLFGKPFHKSRPKWLNNSVTGMDLELDCYEPSMGLAVEYQGQQHYKQIPYFHKNREHFLNGKYRDEMKRRMCVENGVVLIEVPYTVKLDQIEPYLKRAVANIKN